MSQLLAGLNPEQLAAVTLPPQHALILAGAGSGKTRVLTTRIAWLLQTARATPASILAVTFTNKAAKEMVTRLSTMLAINLRGVWIGTFHGLCNRLLRAHHREAGLPALFQILDQADQLAAIKRLEKSLNIDDEKYPPRELQHFINANKEQGLRPAAVEAWDEFTRRRVELYDAYERQCSREGVVDFAELLLRSYELLSRNDALRHHYQSRFKHILVDEFQDTNVLQYRWLKLLAGAAESAAAAKSLSPAARAFQARAALREAGGAAGSSQGNGAAHGDVDVASSAASDGGMSSAAAGPPQGGAAHGNVDAASSAASDGGTEGGTSSIFAVGDDDQSIYGFRGAEVGNMRDFEREFAVGSVIRLEQNYRSHGNILDAANAIIKHNAGRLGKSLWTDAGHGEPIRIFEATSDIEEARWIIEEIKALSREGHAHAEMALLYRSNAQSRVLEHTLFSAGLPYRVYGGLRFFERQEIKHALAYLRLIANRDDDTAFVRVVNFPSRGIGARTLEQLADLARAQNCSLFAAVAHLDGRAAATLGKFTDLIEKMSQGAADLPLPELVDQVIALAGLLDHYRNEKEGSDRIANLEELVNACASFLAEKETRSEETEETSDLAAFLAHASLEAGEHQAGDSDDAVQLMTVHAAKGLEFNVVFLSGLEEGLFPHEQSIVEPKNLEEERRLMYVAVTRARRRLYLSLAQTRMLHGQTRYNLPSRFVDEIPAALLKWLTPKMRPPYASARARPEAAQDWELAKARPRVSTPALRPRLSQREANDTGFAIGQNVHHSKFGPGVIIQAEGSGQDARVQVNFSHAGVKWLALSVAKLTPA